MHEGCSRAVLPKSNEEYWLPKLEKNKKNDLENKEKLENSGWKVLIIWECELKKKNRDETLKKLYRDIVDE